MCQPRKILMLPPWQWNLTAKTASPPVPLGCIDYLTLSLRLIQNTTSAAWPNALVLSVTCSVDMENFMTWPGGAITLSAAAGTANPYISQKLDVTAIAALRLEVDTVSTAAGTGYFSCYGEGW